MKLIYYTDAENQLFNLKNDPEELFPIQDKYTENKLILSKFLSRLYLSKFKEF